MRPLRPLGDDAVSPVIGIILMVAITVILTTVVGTLVLNLGSQGNEPSPYVNWRFEPTPNGADYSGPGDTIEIRHMQGDKLEEEIAILVDGERIKDNGNGLKYTGQNPGSITPFGPGDSVTVEDISGSGTAIERGDKVVVVYRPDKPKLRTVMDSGTVE